MREDSTPWLVYLAVSDTVFRKVFLIYFPCGLFGILGKMLYLEIAQPFQLTFCGVEVLRS